MTPAATEEVFGRVFVALPEKYDVSESSCLTSAVQRSSAKSHGASVLILEFHELLILCIVIAKTQHKKPTTSTKIRKSVTKSL